MSAALETLREAEVFVQQMKQAAEQGDWERLPELDKSARSLFETALLLYPQDEEGEQRRFHELGGVILTEHKQTLELAQSHLEALRREVAGALKSGKVARSYSYHSD